MTIKSISEINIGDYVTIQSNKGRFPDAPWSKQVGVITTTGSMISADEADIGRFFQLDMAYYLGTTRLTHPVLQTDTVTHTFSQ